MGARVVDGRAKSWLRVYNHAHGDLFAGERGGVYEARRLGVPKGHYPPPGECRIWYPGEPPGQQPPPARCDRLVGRVPFGAFVLYNGKEWDSRYDWREHERRNRGSVPGVILDLMGSVRR